ncbi:VanZ family protein [Mycetocola reblochoni]|uniref:Membrane protein, putative n=2 Tax=Mycetocola reblochoni TaxID=331618 RepID=A0A1R4KDF8_9MICO|nr:VanZ family protein [Mycetocola reblochoni]RLP69001.1 VanZ family protein [Mycetocola reblochoni]SJN42317.1 membrane protein, putative [Mycetocola reblochoni REB411]
MSNPIISPAVGALLVGSGLAVVLAVPYVAAQYRRYGRLGFWRLVGNVALLIYVIALFSYTLMPFPESTQVVRCMPAQLDPFRFLSDIAAGQAAADGRLLRNTAFLQVAFNVLLFMPLGVLLRGLARRGAIVATLTGFAASLLIELTQLTGLWGVYSCAYRVFDVDDLIANTGGALLGSLIALPVFAFSGPASERVARPVTAGRRLVGMVVDVFIIGAAGFVLTLGIRTPVYLSGGELDAIPSALSDATGLWIPLALQLLSVLATGATLGEHVVALRAVTGPVPAPLARPIRFLAGIGGYGLLLAAEFPGAGVVTALLVLASIVAVFVGDRRGLACAVAGMRVVDNVPAPVSAG